jgi:hypothetical protein
MSKSAYKPRQFRSLKEAVTALVNANGGIREAAAACRVQGASLFRYTDETDENSDRHMPVDIVEALESAAGVPIVTEYLAEKAQCQLLPVIFEVTESDLNVDLANTGRRAAMLFQDWADAVANDGIIDREEAKRLLRDNIELVRTLMHMRADLEARIADPETPDHPLVATPASSQALA